MRAKEFITEYIDDLYDWVDLAKRAIMTRIENGEIPNNPDSIKAAATELAINMKDLEGENIADITPEFLANEVESAIAYASMKQSHLPGSVNFKQSAQLT